MRFVDSNLLLYAISKNAREKTKTELAREILRSRDLAMSVQVFQEFYVQATRATHPNRISHEQATTLLKDFGRFPIQEMTVALFEAALRTKERFQISYWDAAIIEAARALGCDTVLSEDLNHGQDYGGVRVVNPFRDTSRPG